MVSAQFSIELTTLSDLKRLIVTICDGCGERIDDPQEVIVVIRTVRLVLHMHDNCADLLETLLSQLPTPGLELYN